ncbi:hypothetical protein Tco_0474501 [Tanacetum coccineum]
MLEELVKEPIVGTSKVRPTTSNIRIDCIKETTTCSLFSPESILTGEKILCAHASGSPNTPATSAAGKSTLPKIIQQPSTECSALTNVPAITQEIFRDARDFTLPINATDIIELLVGDKIGANILTLFSSIRNDGSSVIADSVLLLLLIQMKS